MQITTGGEQVRVMRRCVENLPTAPTSGEPALREVQSRHWAACHYVEGFEQAPVTQPDLAYKRPEQPLAQEAKA